MTKRKLLSILVDIVFGIALVTMTHSILALFIGACWSIASWVDGFDIGTELYKGYYDKLVKAINDALDGVETKDKDA